MFNPLMVQEMAKGILESLMMTLTSTLIGYVLGLPLGILLVVLGHFMEQFRFGFKPIGATFICISVFTTFSFYTRNTIQLYL